MFVVCLQMARNGLWGLSARHEMKSTAGNDNRRVEQILPYFKGVAFFRNKHYPNRSVHDAFCIYFNITIS